MYHVHDILQIILPQLSWKMKDYIQKSGLSGSIKFYLLNSG